MIRISGILFSLLFVAVATAAPTPPAPADPAGIQFFENKIRPILADHCYKCHSTEATKAGKLKGELLLDSREGVARGGKSGPILVSGKPAESRMIEAVKYTNVDLQMPPKDRLPPEAVADLEKWVAMGAPDPRSSPIPLKAGIDIEAGKKFWSFQPLHRAAAPAVKNAGWVRTPIDQFIRLAQEQKGLTPNAPASREKLIRRAYFDLLGLPPTPEEVAAFIHDPAPDAYENLIDRLLQNPHYGERWARHWLDVARFGESDGFEQDYDRPGAYHFRDFVIRALNADMPFDRFVQLQIAGDEIAPDDSDAMAATGFLTAGVFPTQITEKEFESTRYNQLDDMVATTGNAMLGLTIGCARCHDHKYDPIPSADYYRMAATFATAIRSDVDLDFSTSDERNKASPQWKAQVAEVHAKLNTFEHGELEQKFKEYLAQLKQSPKGISTGTWSVLACESVKTVNGMVYTLQPDGSYLKTSKSPPKETVTFSARVETADITAIRLEAMADKSLPNNGPGAASNGNFSLSEIEVTAAPADGSAQPAAVKIISATATHEQNAGDLSVASSFDGDHATGWAVDGGGIGKTQTAIFNFEKPVGFPSGTLLTITLRFEHFNAHHIIGRPRLSITTHANPKDFGDAVQAIDPKIAKILHRLAAGQDVKLADRDRARASFAASLPEYSELKTQLATLEHEGPPKKLSKVQVTSEGLPPVKNNADGRGYPHFYPVVYILRRGDPNNKVEPANFSFLHVLMRDGKDESFWKTPPPAGARTSFRRTALAHWMTDTDHGGGNILARVIVNRLWQHHFGRGIVATPNDFGVQGERPTHPELLEWLAADLVDHGWNLKRLHKLMMTSAVYMQGAETSPANTAIDPANAFLWRWQPRRLEAEPIRDSILAVSGLLDDTMYGPGTLDQSMRRRSIYFRVKRSQLVPMMMVLDWPEGLSSMGARPTTTVAPQALLFMNSPQARQYSEAFARRIGSESASSSIEMAYRIAFGRPPEKSETEMAIQFIDHQSAAYRAAGNRNAQLDAMTDFCQALVSANEFVYVD